MNKDQTESDSDHSVKVHYDDNADRQNHIPRTTYAYIFTFPFFGGKLKFGSDDGKKNNNVTTSTHAAATATTTTTKVTMMTMLTLNILINLWQ